MKPNSVPTAPLRHITHSIVIFGTILFTISTPRLRAQVGDNNPTGVSGIFNGQAGGFGYHADPGNATRGTPDMSGAGAGGGYPAALLPLASPRPPSPTRGIGDLWGRDP